MEIEILKNPIEDRFFNLVRETSNNFYFTSPFINEEPIEKLIKNLGKNVKLKGLTYLSLGNIRKGVLNINSLKKLERKGNIKTSKRFLHSKIYIFDKEKAIITSSNLTKAGLNYNFEYGVLIKNKKLILEIIDDFNTLYNSEDFGKISKKTLKEIENILEKLPKNESQKRKNDYKFELEYDDKIAVEDKEIIFKNLRGWKKLTFEIIDKNLNEFFYLKDLQKFKVEFERKYPNNDTIDHKIRQQLQYLRDLGLIEFIERGYYRKLWE